MATIIDRDSWLEPFRPVLERREHHYGVTRYEIDQRGGLLGAISQGHHYFGLNPADGRLVYREWLPGATYVSLVGDFNFWDRGADPLTRDEFGVWSVSIDPDRLPHGARLKVHIDGQDRLPAYIRRVTQEPDRSFVGQYWNPGPYAFVNPRPRLDNGLRIYEAHVGMATEEGKVGTFHEFCQNVLPRIKRLGYNAVQLMAVQEHPYYGSFGYHVSNFFAVSSRFGTPEDLKQLIDEAHGLGLLVFLDLVHSHSVKNTAEGLNRLDGSDHLYFHAGSRGEHKAWDSMLFDYSKYEVRRFLLSNVRYWLEEFQFDGFRFDGVTSMLYHDHGMGDGFASYQAYFGGNVDEDGLLYLKLANEVAHAVLPSAITIAEDVSGMPGVARPVAEMGVGFDYRLSMGIPDAWFSLIGKQKDEEWRLGGLYDMLLNRRREEKHVAYVESHDQALVGDKTLAFWLMDASMYTDMAHDKPNLVIDRGVALHKMIRLFTFSLGGEGYLNFMGNEFGHPEWIDFPREGNGNSYHHARRQWSLASNGFLRYAGLDRFDAAMQRLDSCFSLLTDPLIEQLLVDEQQRVLVYRHGPLVFAFNFDANRSIENLNLPVPEQQDYVTLLTSDDQRFDGNGRVSQGTQFPWLNEPIYGREQRISIYLPNRTATVLIPARLLETGEEYWRYIEAAFQDASRPTGRVEPA